MGIARPTGSYPNACEVLTVFRNAPVGVDRDVTTVPSIEECAFAGLTAVGCCRPVLADAIRPAAKLMAMIDNQRRGLPGRD